MSTTLYRKYRPQAFGEIVNQEHIKATIQQEIVSAKLPHAFLFCGPRGTGKTTTARVLAKSLNCKNRKEGESEPCNNCPSCDAMNKGASLNLVEVDAASQTGVDNVRDNIIANARVSVKSDEYKIFIIDEVHMLSTSSFNALLKTLEEPPQRVMFILATTEIHKIPETIISRCQRFDFHPIKAAVLQPYLAEIVKKEKREVEDAVLAAIVKKSGGYVRDAMSLLGQVLTLPGKITTESASFILPVPSLENVIAFYSHIVKRDPAAAVTLLQKLENEGLRPAHFAQQLIETAHHCLLFTVGSHPDIFQDHGDEARKQLEEIAKGRQPRQWLEVVDALIRRHQQLKNLDLGVLPLELLAVELTAEMAAPAAAPVQAPATVSTPRSTPPPSKPKSSQATPVPAKPAVKPEQPPVNKPLFAASKPAAATIVSEPDGPASKYSDIKPVWRKITLDVSEAQHSLFIVLKSGVLREGANGEAELAFKYRMHHDHIKRYMGTIVEQAKKHLPNQEIRFTLAIDEKLDFNLPGDVEEPKQAETQALGAELSRLAEAFGGAVLE